jgi:N-acetylmuramoyl-L-alanine amidase
MRAARALLFLFATVLLASAQNPLKNLEKIRVGGVDYVRFKEWCDEANFDFRWVKRDDDFQITNRIWKLSFSVDSRKAQINGMNFLLSMPIISRSNVPFISGVDLQTAIQPILFPPKNPSGKNIATICLDPGHGGKDPGNMEKRNQEKKYTLLLAEEIAQILRQAGLKVILTRTNDRFVELPDRAAFANRNGADLFVSLHYNSSGSSFVNGMEVYCLSPAGTMSSNEGGGRSDTGSFPGNVQNEKNMLLAYQIQKSLLNNLSGEDRGVKRARFEVLREVKMPAVLIEGGFMSNSAEAKRIYDSTHRKKMALALANGILAYKHTVETLPKAEASKR